MKIAFLLPSLKPTGPVQVALDLGKLFSTEHEVWYFYFDDLPGNQQLSNSEQVSFKEKRSFKGFDIIHSHGLRPDAYIRWHHRHIIPKKITTLHNYVHEDLKYQYNALVSTIFSRVWRWAVSKHDRVIVLSNDMKAYYNSRFGQKNCTVIPNTRLIPASDTDKETEGDIRAFKGESILLGNASYVNQRKGLDQAVKLLALNPRLKFIHFGEGEEIKNLKQLAISLGVEDRVWFRGFAPDAKAYYKLFDVFVMPSRSEGFPLAMLEAVQARVPIVASDIPVFREIFNETEVVKFKPENTNAFLMAIDTAVKSRDALVANALHKFDSCYSPAIVKQSYLELYSKAIATK